MKFLSVTVFVLAMSLAATVTVSAQDKIEAEYQRIINERCSQCHTPARIEQALERGENIDEIITKMIRFGARLNDREEEVMGIFWTAQQATIKNKSAASPPTQVDPLGEYRAILERRCTGCHSLAPVDRAMRDGRSLNELLDLMAARGVIISPAEKSVLGTFWGTPFKADLPQ